MDGIGVFTDNVLKILTQKHPEVSFHFVFDREPHKKFLYNKNIEYTVLPPKTRHPVLYYYWFEYLLPKLIKKVKPDLFLSPDGFLSLKSNCKQLAVIHDLNFEHYPEFLPPAYRLYYCKFFPQYAKKANRIATVSEFSKQDLAELYGIDKNKIDVVYNGTDDSFHPLNEEDKKNVRQKFSKGNPYFLFVGSIHPRKNLKNLFLAFNHFKKHSNSSVKLLIAGKTMWPKGLKEIYESIEAKDDITFLGRVNSKDLRLLTGGALALTYVPFFEGFGIPVIDAMKCGVPVITSNSSSLPEISGGAALLANPNDVKDISKKMETLLKDDDLRKSLIAKGLENVQRFTWEKTADLLWESIYKTINN